MLHISHAGGGMCNEIDICFLNSNTLDFAIYIEIKMIRYDIKILSICLTNLDRKNQIKQSNPFQAFFFFFFSFQEKMLLKEHILLHLN